jgi:peptidyl-prolyl cis-trans isomerase C
MKLTKTGILLASAASMLALGACNQTNDTQSKSPAAVTVNGTAISQRTVDLLAKQNAGSGRPDTPETRKFIIDQLALQVVVAEEAVKKGLDKKPEIAEQIDAMKQSVLANAYVQDFINNNPVSDDMVKAEYERIKATITGDEYKARHILVAKESEAKDIIARLNKEPGAFAKLAAEKSMDQGSKARGGDLGWFDPKRMVPEFGAAVAKLEKGKFTQEPVRTQYGFHVILLEDVKPIQAPPMEEVKAQLSQQLQEQNLKKQFDALKAKAKIEISSAPAPAPAVPAAIK